ncbi:hypothetical protein [Nitrospira sp. Nam74]
MIPLNHSSSFPAVESGIPAQIPIKRFGTRTTFASAVLDLASAKSVFIVDPELVVDGGMSQL